MMRPIATLSMLLLLTAALAVPTARAQVDTLWSETWEDDSWTNRWFADFGTWEVGMPESGPDSAFAGESLLATRLAGNYVEGVDTRMIQIDPFTVPPAADHPRLRFQHWYRFGSGDGGYVQVRAVGETEWTTVVQYGASAYTKFAVEWIHTLIDLRSFAGQQVQVAFYFFSRDTGFGDDTAPGWYVDELTLLTGPRVLVNPEDWESGWHDWYVDFSTWQVGVPTSGPDSAYAGVRLAATRLSRNYGDNSDARLISPEFTVPSSDLGPRLRFQQWYSFSSSDGGTVQILPEGENEWVSLLGPYAGSSGGVWSRPLASLTPYAGQRVQLAFYFYSRDAGFGDDTGPGWYVDDVVIECNDGGVVIPCSATDLPVELSSALETVRDGRDVVISWQTASETNNAGFEVQHATRTAPWRTVAFVEGAGTTTHVTAYEHRLVGLAPGLHRLRLKQVDLDGGFTYSDAVEVAVETPGAYVLSDVYPNPFNPAARFTLAVDRPQRVRVDVFDVQGRRVAVVHDGVVPAHEETAFRVEAGALPSGVYLLRVRGETFHAARVMTLLR